jgi:hypothetical protein
LKKRFGYHKEKEEKNKFQNINEEDINDLNQLFENNN